MYKCVYIYPDIHRNMPMHLQFVGFPIYVYIICICKYNIWVVVKIMVHFWVP